MRNYSEIGCLTLLGVTLTVYVAVGNCQPEQNMSDWLPKNINAEPVGKGVSSVGGKHYVVRVSTNSLQQNSGKKTFSGFSTINIAGTSGISGIPVFPVHTTYYSLPDSFFSVIYEKDGTPLPMVCNSCLYKDPLSAFSGEIRAGPLV